MFYKRLLHDRENEEPFETLRSYVRTELSMVLACKTEFEIQIKKTGDQRQLYMDVVYSEQTNLR